MPARIEAIINYELLIWARKSAGLDIYSVATKTYLKPEKIEEWEKGLSRPSIPQLRKLAAAYKRPIAVFFLPEPPKKFDAIRDFRKLPMYHPPQKSPELLYEIRRAHQRREVALDLSGPRRLSMHIQQTVNPIEVSEKIRKYLGFTIARQIKLRNKRLAFNEWKAAIEDKGVLVFQTSTVELDEMRGMSIGKNPFPAIVLNGKDSYAGRSFTLLHEFTHILLGGNGLCNLEASTSHSTGKMEIFCNEVAGNVLVPFNDISRESFIEKNRDTLEWPDEDIRSLEKKYSVSQEVILRRLLTIKAISSEFYVRKREELQDLYEKQIEEELRKRRESKSFVPNHIIVARNNGESYTRLILSAYYNNKITLNDVSDYLEVKLKNLGKIENIVFAR